MQFGRGYNPDTREQYASYLTMQHLGAVAGRVIKSNLKGLYAAQEEGVDDQSITSRCVGETLSKGCNVRLRLIGKPAPRFSAKGVYDLARMVERKENGGSVDDPLVDLGCIPAHAIRGMRIIGVPYESTWPSTDVARINDEPPLDVLEEASSFEVVGTYAIVTDHEDKVTDIKNGLNAAYPIGMAIPADDAFDDYKSGVIESFDPKVKSSNHMVLCVAYETLSTGEVIFWFINSYGTGWGEGGFFKVSSKAIVDPRIDSLYALPLAPKSAPKPKEK